MSVTDVELRQLIRSLIREVATELQGVTLTGATDEGLLVRIGDDDDLNAFAQRVLNLASDCGKAAAIRSGTMRFQLNPIAGLSPTAVGAPERLPSKRSVGKIVTEKNLLKSSDAGGRLLVSGDTVVTPLARDRARELGITIEREG